MVLQDAQHMLVIISIKEATVKSSYSPQNSMSCYHSSSMSSIPMPLILSTYFPFYFLMEMIMEIQYGINVQMYVNLRASACYMMSTLFTLVIMINITTTTTTIIIPTTITTPSLSPSPLSSIQKFLHFN